jgi:hypothetical protein
VEVVGEKMRGSKVAGWRERGRKKENEAAVGAGTVKRQEEEKEIRVCMDQEVDTGHNDHHRRIAGEAGRAVIAEEALRGREGERERSPLSRREAEEDTVVDRTDGAGIRPGRGWRLNPSHDEIRTEQDGGRQKENHSRRAQQ